MRRYLFSINVIIVVLCALFYFYGTVLKKENKTEQPILGIISDSVTIPDFIKNEQGYVAKNRMYEAALPILSNRTVKIANRKSLSFTPINTQSVEGKVQGNTIIYANAYSSSDIQYETTKKGIKESIILRSPSNLPEEFTYTFDAQDQKAALGDDNSITFTQISKEPSREIPVSDGSVLDAKKAANFLPEYPKRFKIPPPVMIDASGKKSSTSDVQVILTGNTLSLRPSKVWLSKAKFPVILDPTVESTPQIVEEDAGKRTLTSKDFLNDDGTYSMVIFQNPIHYKEGNMFKDIDRSFTQSSDPNYQYEVTTGIYTAKLRKTLDGENSDIQLAFSNASIGFSPTKIGWSNGDNLGTVKNVTGEISTDSSKVVYKSMFGVEGIDLEAIYDNEKFLKETVIQSPQSIHAQNHKNHDLEISFDLNLPQDVDLNVDGQIWDKTNSVVTQDKITVVKNGKEISDLKKAIVYGKEAQDTQTIKIKLSKDGGRLVLTKIISGLWLAKVSYPVRTDTTTTIYGVAGDGFLIGGDGDDWDQGYQGVYSVARAMGNPSSTTNDIYNIYVGQNINYGDYFSEYACYEGFVAFDTSGIPDTDVVSDETLSLYLMTDSSTTDFTIQARQKTWAGGGLTTDDGVAGESLTGQTLLATLATSGIGATGAYKDFTSDAGFAAQINLTGNTEIILNSSRQSGNNAPTQTEYIMLQDADYTGTDQDPKLVVIHAPAEPTPTPTPIPAVKINRGVNIRRGTTIRGN